MKTFNSFDALAAANASHGLVSDMSTFNDDAKEEKDFNYCMDNIKDLPSYQFKRWVEMAAKYAANMEDPKRQAKMKAKLWSIVKKKSSDYDLKKYYAHLDPSSAPVTGE